MFKKTSLFVFTLACGISSSIIHSDIVAARNLDNDRKPSTQRSAHPKYSAHSKHKHYKIKTKPVIQHAEQSLDASSSGGCQGQCTKSENF